MNARAIVTVALMGVAAGIIIIAVNQHPREVVPYTPVKEIGTPDADWDSTKCYGSNTLKQEESCPETIEEIVEHVSLVSMTDERLQAEDVIVVLKAKWLMGMYSFGKLRTDPVTGKPACWHVGLGMHENGSVAGGRKVVRGDRRTPEGWYRISEKKASGFAGALIVHYPNLTDAKLARTAGIISEVTYERIATAHQRGSLPPQDTDLGGDILFHGGGGITNGCVGLMDKDLDAFRGLLPPKLSDVWTLLLP
ncbi:MAG: hypothetical protein Q7R83_01700 [bacterium]|nr:hypothetical protein [bacterium]